MKPSHHPRDLDWRDRMRRTEVARRAKEKLDFWLEQVKEHGDTCVCIYCCELNEFIRSVP